MNKFTFILPVILCSNLLLSVQEQIIDSSLPENSSLEVASVTKKSIFKVFPSKDRINLKKEAILSSRNFGKKMDYVIAGAATVVCAGLIYKFSQYIFKAKNVSKSKTLNNYDLTNKLLKLEKHFKDVKEPSLLSADWFKKAGTGILTGIASSVATGFLMNFYKKYHSFEDLKTFIENRLSPINVENKIQFNIPENNEGLDSKAVNEIVDEFGLAINKVLYDIKIFDGLFLNSQDFDKCKSNKSCDVRDSIIAKNKFVASLRNIVEFTESVIAFMEYKLDSVDNEILEQEYLLMPDYLFDSLNNYCKKVQLVLEGSSDETLNKLTSEFKDSSVNTINIFYGFEARNSWLS